MKKRKKKYRFLKIKKEETLFLLMVQSPILSGRSLKISIKRKLESIYSIIQVQCRALNKKLKKIPFMQNSEEMKSTD